MKLARHLLSLVLASALATAGAAADPEPPAPDPSPTPTTAIPTDPAYSEEVHETPQNQPQGWTYTLDSRILTEAWSFFQPAGSSDSDYLFCGIRSRLGLRYEQGDFAARVELQDVQLIDLPTQSVAPSPAGSLGSGANYFSYTQSSSLNTLGIRKAYLRIGERDINSLQVGRFDYFGGMETTCKDPVLDWLKRERVSKKLIGCPDYNTWSRTFDGARLDLDTEPLHLTAVVLRPTEISPHFYQPVAQVVVSNLSLTFKEDEAIPNGELQLFWNHYSDDRLVPQVDNRPGSHPSIQADGGNQISTYGLHYLTRLGSDGDFLLWYARQTGRWGSLQHSASGMSIEAGWRFPDLWAQPWLRCGLSVYSGDKDPRDGTHGTFMASVPDNRTRFPFYTLANLRNPKVQLMLHPAEDTRLRFDYHWLSLDSAQDVWYTGSGVTQGEGVNGYSSRPSGGSRDLGRLLEIWLDQKIDDNQKLVFHYGRAWGGQVVGTTFPNRQSGQLFYTEYRLSFP